MKEILNHGDIVLWNGKRVTCTAKHAQGIWHTYHFNDGSSFNGDVKAMFASGVLQEVELPKIKINAIPPWTPKGKLDGPISNKPSKED